MKAWRPVPGPRCALAAAGGVALALAALAPLAASQRAAEAQTALTEVGSAVVLPGAGSPQAGMAGGPFRPIAVAPVDGSVEVAGIQTPGGLGPPTAQVLVAHYASDGQASPAVAASGNTSDAQLDPSVAALLPAGFVVVWLNEPAGSRQAGGTAPGPAAAAGAARIGAAAVPRSAGAPGTVSARLLDGAGQPVGAEIQVSASGEQTLAPRVSALGGGGFAATWLSGAPVTGLAGRLFDGAGNPLTPEIRIAAATVNVGLIGLGDGSFVAAWAQDGSGFVWQRFDASGAPLGGAVTVPANNEGGAILLAANAAGQLAAAWNTTDASLRPQTAIRVQLWNALDGTPLASAVTVAASDATGEPFLGGLGVDLEGRTLVAWSDAQGGSSVTRVQLLDAGGAPVAPPVQVNAATGSPHVAQTVAAASDGAWNVAWTDYSNGYLQQLTTASCGGAAASSLCLDGNRFRASVQFTAGSGGPAGAGAPVPLADNTGALWFFDPENPELLVKILDGTAIDGHFWVFYASLTDVEFDLTIADTQTGASRVYHNPAGTLASVADLNFPQSAGASRPDGAAASAAGRPAPEPEPGGGTRHGGSVAPGVAGYAPASAVGPTPAPAAGSAVCAAADLALCLLGSVYTVSVTWQDPASGASGGGRAVQVSADGGYFWFFGPGSAELAVKVLDGTAINGHIWVFYASLTDVEFDLTVSDDAATPPVQRTYHNPAGTLASVADVGAF